MFTKVGTGFVVTLLENVRVLCTRILSKMGMGGDRMSYHQAHASGASSEGTSDAEAL